ncbi:hypothetical protein G6F65_020830 [Rhizopus arrhizus]|nr:hypothetical protein G6F65_020830 [Rhizopus arrhizus]
MANIELGLINEALERTQGVVAHAAQLLGLRRTTLVEKLRKQRRRNAEHGKDIPRRSHHASPHPARHPALPGRGHCRRLQPAHHFGSTPVHQPQRSTVRTGQPQCRAHGAATATSAWPRTSPRSR